MCKSLMCRRNNTTLFNGHWSDITTRFGPSCSTKDNADAISAHSCISKARNRQTRLQLTLRPVRCLHFAHTCPELHLNVGTSRPTGHCKKVGRMVMSACSPTTGIYTSPTLKSVKLEANLLALTTLRVVTSMINGMSNMAPIRHFPADSCKL